MRLFVKNRNRQKVYLDVTARTKREFVNKVGMTFFVLGEKYSVYQVQAEPSSNDTAGGALIGGLIGLLGGGVGVLVGGMAGGLLGKTNDDKEKRLVHHFNRSSL